MTPLIDAAFQEFARAPIQTTAAALVGVWVLVVLLTWLVWLDGQ